jgi:hypothetical protein
VSHAIIRLRASHNRTGEQFPRFSKRTAFDKSTCISVPEQNVVHHLATMDRDFLKTTDSLTGVTHRKVGGERSASSREGGRGRVVVSRNDGIDIIINTGIDENRPPLSVMTVCTFFLLLILLFSTRPINTAHHTRLPRWDGYESYRNDGSPSEFRARAIPARR